MYVADKKIDANVFIYIAFFVVSLVLLVMGFASNNNTAYCFGAYFLFASLGVFPYYYLNAYFGGVTKGVKILLGILGLVLYLAISTILLFSCSYGAVHEFDTGGVCSILTASFVLGTAVYVPGYFYGFAYKMKPFFYMLLTLTSFIVFPIYFIMGIVGLVHFAGPKSKKDNYTD